jgi:hypothetical protein
MTNKFSELLTTYTQEYKMSPGECPKVWLKSLLTLADAIMVQEYKMEPGECPRRWSTMSGIPCTQEYKMDPGPHPEPWVLEIDPKIKKQLLIARYKYLIACANAEIEMFNKIIAELNEEK